jgi:hypothetical protein
VSSHPRQKQSELGAAFQNAQKGAQFRNTLTELGYPQRATPILVDNMVAEGLATDIINAKRRTGNRHHGCPVFLVARQNPKIAIFHPTYQRKMECTSKRFFHETIAKGQI